MRDSLERKDAAGAAGTGVSAARRFAMPALAALVLAVVCCAHAAVAAADTPESGAIGYLCAAMVYFACAVGFRMQARSAERTLRMRWILMSGAALAAAGGFVPSYTQIFLHTGTLRQFQSCCFNVSEALYMLAVVLFFAGVGRSIVVVDLLQALLFVVLRFNLAYSPLTRDHFTHIHLVVAQLVALFLLLAALVACLGAASRAELQFLRTISWFFGAHLVAYFASDQISYVWMGHQNSSTWDVGGSVLLAGFAVYLLRMPAAEAETEAEPSMPRRRSITVRSLMPSFLALVNLMLGLFLLKQSLLLAGAAITLSVVCYVARTALLQAHTAAETERLESRNEHLEGLAICDPLTGIGNRRSLAGVYMQLQETESDRGVALLLMDIDAFKLANDRHGHLHGDEVLVALSRKLEDVVASVAGSHCARFGGDEFALLLPGVSAQEASAMAEELRRQFAAHAFEPENAHTSLSIGVASLSAARDLPLEMLVSWADKALYRAKLLGRNRVEAQPVWKAGDSTGSGFAAGMTAERVRGVKGVLARSSQGGAFAPCSANDAR